MRPLRFRLLPFCRGTLRKTFIMATSLLKRLCLDGLLLLNHPPASGPSATIKLTERTVASCSLCPISPDFHRNAADSFYASFGRTLLSMQAWRSLSCRATVQAVLSEPFLRKAITFSSVMARDQILRGGGGLSTSQGVGRLPSAG